MNRTNPLFIDEVLHTVFDHLDFRSLKKCRQVCKAWNFIASKKVRLVLFGKYEEQQRDSLEGLLTSVSLPSFINVEVRGNFGVHISTLLHMIGSKIQSFTVNAGKQRVFCKLSDFPDLVLHAKLLISVLEESQYKYFKFLDVYKRNPLWTTVWKIVSDWESPYFVEYIELCPNLETLLIPSQKNYLQGLRSFFGSERLDALYAENKLQSLREINFNLLKNETEYLKKFSSFSWSLAGFEITINSLIPIPAVRSCLLQLSPTLTSLVVQIAPLFDEYHSSLNRFRADNWIFPTGLNNLKSLSIISIGNKRLITRSLIAALQLPKLQNLSLKGFADENAFHKMVGDNMEDLESTSLTSLEICCRREKFLDHDFFLRGINPWPNIKELKVTRPTILLLCSVFKALQGIESLEMLLEISKGKRVIPWDSILGNAPFDPTNEKFLLTTDLPDLSVPRPCLKDLKNLKSLKIGFTLDATESSDWKLTDHFIYHVLMNLKGLQYFHATQHKFTAGALDKLRSEMHPFCNINTKSCRRLRSPVMQL